MISRYIVGVLSLSTLSVLSACSITGTSDRSHVPQDTVLICGKQHSVTGNSARHHSKNVYRYFPSNSVYYDVENGRYFYLDGNRWITSSSIPATLSGNIGSFVSLEIASDKPYMHHDEVLKKISSGTK